MNVKVNVKKLIKILKDNRAEHRKIFLEALEGYRNECIKTFEKQLSAAKAGKDFTVFFELHQPVDQTADYDRIIGMLEMSTDIVINLTETEYQSYVLDKWDWKANFIISNAGYSPTASATSNLYR